MATSNGGSCGPAIGCRLSGSWRTYDQFLKANRVDAGLKNYGEVVTLILGTAADAEGRPRRRR